MKFDVTFYFENCSPTVTVDVDHKDEAIGKARLRDYPPVPDHVPASCVYSGPGGKRQGSGVKQGSKRTCEPRTIKKQIRWTENEWACVVRQAKLSGLDVADYQRKIILSADINE